MKKINCLLILCFLLSCQKPVIWKESSWTFILPEKEIFVKTTKYPGGKFTIIFAPDSLLLNNSKDFIEFRTGSYIQIVVDSADIYVNSLNGMTKIQNMGNHNFNFKVISDSIFHSFFFNHKIKYPYSFISIDTKEYGISVNQEKIKKGDIHGGW